ncbi:MAG TPA: hypothetical protein VNA19_17795 [Pyrinomonadaceae bacterium]|jgi:hypothetical protein|nr:hypothetical protein [Pyrinomonadaceae bacterium]
MNDNETKVNSAQRLINILSAAINVQDHNQQARTAWAEVFGIENPRTESGLLSVISRLVALKKVFAEVEEALRRIPNINEELFIAPVSRLANVASINSLTDSFSGYTRHLSQADMTALKFSEHQLSQYPEFNESQVPSKDLKDILIEVDNLIERILGSSLPEELRTSLLELLHEVRKGVLEYRIRGAVALRDTLTKSLGILAANKEDVEENKESDEVQSLGRMLVRIDKAYTFALKMKPMLEAAANILPRLLT